jgi:excisionase family DNA binding protein
MTSICERSDFSLQHQNMSKPAVMLTVADVAAMLACSTKTVYRLVDRGAIPRPVRLGGMLRWHRAQLERWLADGCPPLHRG